MNNETTAATAAAAAGHHPHTLPASDGAGLGTAEYTYPLDAASMSQRLYGESASFKDADAHRIFRTGSIHSYNPATLFADLKHIQAEQQHVQQQQLQQQGQQPALPGEALRVEEDELDAVMREGRDKQSAAGAAAVAAAMLEGRKAADGIAMVPNHPLPVVFPRPDGLPPPLRFIHKFGPGGARHARPRLHQREGEEGGEGAAAPLRREVVEETEVESFTVRQETETTARVWDANGRAVAVRPVQHFRELAALLPERLLQRLYASGFHTPTLLQVAALPLLVEEGGDLMGVAPVSSGRTVASAAAALPLLYRVLESEADAARAPVSGLAPVVLQLCSRQERVLRAATTYRCLAEPAVRVLAVSGAAADGGPTGACDVLVTTPAYLLELLGAGALDLRGLRFCAVHDVDDMLARGDDAALREVLGAVTADRTPAPPVQMVLWSAAANHRAKELAGTFLGRLQRTVEVQVQLQTNHNMQHFVYPLEATDRPCDGVLKLYEQRIVSKRDQVLVLCSSQRSAEVTARGLAAALQAPRGLVRYLHSGLRSRQQDRVLAAFRAGEVRVLVATDVLPEGLVLPLLEHVINMELPLSREEYVRRVNLVGHAGRPGTVHTLLSPRDPMLRPIATYMQQRTGKALSAAVQELVAAAETMEAAAGDWQRSPAQRAAGGGRRAGGGGAWRVRGRQAQEMEAPRRHRRRGAPQTPPRRRGGAAKK